MLRHEYKYYISNKQKEILKVRLKAVTKKDEHSDSDGSYFIRSLYFDDLNDSLLKEKQNGVDNRHKYRIRYYGSNLDYIVLERKSKINGFTSKLSTKITVDECKLLMKGIIPEVSDDSLKLTLFNELRTKSLIPRCIVSYKRSAYVYRFGNVRITFDEDISSSNQLDKFLDGTYLKRPILKPNELILEVKWDNIFPSHIKNLMRLENYTWFSFSKYYMCRLLHL